MYSQFLNKNVKLVYKDGKKIFDKNKDGVIQKDGEIFKVRS